MPQGLLNLAQAAEFLKDGQVVAYPTEAVFGLGCDPANERAVNHILNLKNRSPAVGLILIADYYDRVSEWVADLDPEMLRKAFSSWPGPVTWLIPQSNQTPDWLTGEHDCLAIRVTAHPVCRALCAEFGGAIVSTSANVTGQLPARTVAEVASVFDDDIAGIVGGEVGDSPQPTEIRDLQSGRTLRTS
jgi:L-threonylcarbamoyladenylate synthase